MNLKRLFIFAAVLSVRMVSAQQPEKVIRRLELSGNGFERGIKHGSEMKTQIAEIYAAWKKQIASDTKRQPDSVIAEFTGNSSFRQTIETVTPDLWQEIRGIAQGSGQPLIDVLAFQLVDEYWAYLDSVAHIQKDHCSAIGFAGNKSRGAVVAQNIDLEGFRQGYQLLLHILPGKNVPEQYIVTCAGMIAFAGMNKHTAVVVNALTDLNTSSAGLPVAFIIRGTLAQKDAGSALSFFRNVRHAAGQNYLLANADSVYDYEASANKTVRFQPTGNSGLLYHTNHSLANHDVKAWKQKYHRDVLEGTGRKGSTEVRFNALQQRLQVDESKYSRELIEETLLSKDHPRFPICGAYSDPVRGFTFSSVIFQLGPKPMARVSADSPDKAPYKDFYFTK